MNDNSGSTDRDKAFNPDLSLASRKPASAAWWWSERLFRALALFVVLGSVLAVFHTYTLYDETSDELIGQGMEWIFNHTYNLETLAPPFAHIATAVGPALLGARPPEIPNLWTSYSLLQIDQLIYQSQPSHSYLYASRMGILPFFLFVVYLVWSRTRRWLGDRCAFVAVTLFCFSAPVLTHTSLATSDMAGTAGFLWAMDRLWIFGRSAIWRNSLWAGTAVALALVTKFTTFPYLVISFVIVVAGSFFYQNPTVVGRIPRPKLLFLSAITCAIVIWGTYMFSVSSLIQSDRQRDKYERIFAKHPSAIALVQHVPALEFFQGLQFSASRNATTPPSYFMGKLRPGGSRLFFPVMVGVKMPIPFLLLSLLGVAFAFRSLLRGKDPYLLLLLAGAASPFLLGLTAKLNIGMRHVLPAIPWLAVLGAWGAYQLWHMERARVAMRSLVIALLSWQALDYVVSIVPDPLPWFNAMAGSDPAWFEVDSDLDWGQDIKRLPAALEKLHAGPIALAAMGPEDPTREGVHAWHWLQPDSPRQGWIVISEFVYRTDPRFAWLQAYQPVGKVGRTLRIYNLTGS